MGGFLFSVGDDTSPGLDIEQADRVSWRIVSRVSQEGETSQAPHPALLWSAKEAAVKSLPPGALLSRVKILRWKRLLSEEGHQFEFQALGGEMGRGVAFHVKNLVIGCTISKKN